MLRVPGAQANWFTGISTWGNYYRTLVGVGLIDLTEKEGKKNEQITMRYPKYPNTQKLGICNARTFVPAPLVAI